MCLRAYLCENYSLLLVRLVIKKVQPVLNQGSFVNVKTTRFVLCFIVTNNYSEMSRLALQVSRSFSVLLYMGIDLGLSAVVC